MSTRRTVSMVGTGLELLGTVFGPCLNWVDKGHTPEASETCEYYVDCFLGQSLSLCWPLPSPSEPVPWKGGWGSATQRPWGMTCIIRQAQGLHEQTAQSHPSIPGAQIDPPIDTQSYARG